MNLMEHLRPIKIIAYGAIGALALFGVDRFVEYESAQAGRTAGREAREEIEKVDIADDQWNELKRLLRDEDLRQLLIDNLQEDGVDNPMDIVEALDG